MTSQGSTSNRVEELATRPFQLLEKHALPAGYERSFKLTKGAISPNRYLLGVESGLLNDHLLSNICQQLNIPEILLTDLLDKRSHANVVLFGFDENAHSPIFKVYLEYWDHIRAHIAEAGTVKTPQLMHRGYKWSCFEPEQHRITNYYYDKKSGLNELHHAIESAFITPGSPVCAHSKAIVETCHARDPKAELIYLNVSEPDSARNSFDINLYPANLKLSEISTQLRLAAAHLEIDSELIERLLRLVADKPLGHISAGCDRGGQEYLTIYYEQSS